MLRAQAFNDENGRPGLTCEVFAEDVTRETRARTTTENGGQKMDAHRAGCRRNRARLNHILEFIIGSTAECWQGPKHNTARLKHAQIEKARPSRRFIDKH